MGRPSKQSYYEDQIEAALDEQEEFDAALAAEEGEVTKDLCDTLENRTIGDIEEEDEN